MRVNDLFVTAPVTVRYTTDDWHTWHEQHCQLIHGTVWHFRVERLDEASDAVRVQYCVSYGARWWDNNGGRNFVALLKSPSQVQQPQQQPKVVLHSSVQSAGAERADSKDVMSSRFEEGACA